MLVHTVQTPSPSRLGCAGSLIIESSRLPQWMRVMAPESAGFLTPGQGHDCWETCFWAILLVGPDRQTERATGNGVSVDSWAYSVHVWFSVWSSMAQGIHSLLVRCQCIFPFILILSVSCTSVGLPPQSISRPRQSVAPISNWKLRRHSPGPGLFLGYRHVNSQVRVRGPPSSRCSAAVYQVCRPLLISSWKLDRTSLR